MDDRVGEARGKEFFDAFRAIIADFSEVEANLMAERQATSAQAGAQVNENLDVMATNEGWVTHTYGVIQEANAILAAAVDMETGNAWLPAGRSVRTSWLRMRGEARASSTSARA